MNVKTKKEFGAVFLAFLAIILFDQLPISQGKLYFISFVFKINLIMKK